MLCPNRSSFFLLYLENFSIGSECILIYCFLLPTFFQKIPAKGFQSDNPSSFCASEIVFFPPKQLMQADIERHRVFNEQGSGGEAFASTSLSRRVGCSRLTMIRARCLRVRQHYTAQKIYQKIYLYLYNIYLYNMRQTGSKPQASTPILFCVNELVCNINKNSFKRSWFPSQKCLLDARNFVHLASKSHLVKETGNRKYSSFYHNKTARLSSAKP